MVVSVCHRITGKDMLTSLGLVRDSFGKEEVSDNDGRFIKTTFCCRDGYTWWVGTGCHLEETWKNNIPGQPEPDNSSILGFSERYRVRIMGYHTDNI